MQVKLVSVTQSLIEDKVLTAEQLIVYVARVSNPSNQLNTETSDKLINYLIRNKHWSPFEHAFMTIDITTSRAIAAQILRHRSFTFQEFSQRYATATEFEPVQLRRQAEKNRQSSEEEFNPEIDGTFTMDGKSTAGIEVARAITFCKEVYDKLIAAGVAKECARMVLPLTTETRIFMTGPVRSWIHYLEQRTNEHTQLEHRQIALKIKEIFEFNFPNISKALDWKTTQENGRQ
jgi:thymidylate synthase (FAD)